MGLVLSKKCLAQKPKLGQYKKAKRETERRYATERRCAAATITASLICALKRKENYCFCHDLQSFQVSCCVAFYFCGNTFFAHFACAHSYIKKGRLCFIEERSKHYAHASKQTHAHIYFIMHRGML